MSECMSMTPTPVKIVNDGLEVTPICTLETGHPYDHFDEVLNYQWENTPPAA